jgi:glycosyltransferase involved in cell wall biosynthesis
MKIGVALCTYNGERYLPAQLQSILEQSRRPDAMVVCDDASQDGTLALLESWARGAGFPVRIVRNEVNLGYLRNFEKAIGLCQADVVVLSDQDDWWLPAKLEKIAALLDADRGAEAVFSDAEIVDESLDRLGYRLFDSLLVSREDRERARTGNLFPALLRRNLVAGATFAFRSGWKERILPIPDGVVHDEWSALVIAAYGGLRFIPEPLILYRQHGMNQIGGRRLPLMERLQRLSRNRRKENERALGGARELKRRLTLDRPPPAAQLSAVDQKVAHLERRLSLAGAHIARVPSVVSELLSGRYSRYSAGWRSAMRDLVSPM